ncbi:MAG: calcium/sodium antiporter [Lachnospiraceae bacterium]|jgi:cation:H+ antiporter|nr:calcium/sodium antiporter [Lachnospiraceae bacterium]
MLALKSIVLMVAGFVILIKGADFFVDGASGIAERFRIPQIIIGLTIVAFGTSAPEAAISISAAFAGTTGIAIGNILGSNLLNILIILGVSACIIPLHIGKSSIRFDIPFNLVITLVLVVYGIVFGRLDVFSGIVFWVLLGAFMVHLFRSAKSETQDNNTVTQDNQPQKRRHILVLALYIVGGIVAIIFGSDLAVDHATVIASDILHIDDRLIGLTIIAFGTSLPELMTSVMAAKKGNADIAVGNILGSNIFNILFVLGTVSLIAPVEFSHSFVIDGVIGIVAVILLYFLSKDDDTLSRRDGVTFLACYAVYFVYLLAVNI